MVGVNQSRLRLSDAERRLLIECLALRIKKPHTDQELQDTFPYSILKERLANPKPGGSSGGHRQLRRKEKDRT